MKTPTTLIIMDGYGLSDERFGNAVMEAKTPVLDLLMKTCPMSRLEASGSAVGLPEGTVGNSEVGHANIGAGRIVYQNFLKILRAIEDGSFYTNKVFVSMLDKCREEGKTAHIFALMSDAGIHSHNEHLWAFLKLAKEKNIEKVYLHCFTDGRDISPSSGIKHITNCVQKCKEIGIGKIATITGRYYAMDRDRRWNRIKIAYDAIAHGRGKYEPDPVKAVQDSYAAGKTDEFINPIICDPEGIVRKGDYIFFLNFRSDRARELTRAFVDENFNGFDREMEEFMPVNFVCLTQYDITMPNVQVAFPAEPNKNMLGEYLSKLGMTQLRVSETEKYAHVTFFFNGDVEEPYEGEDRILVPSSKDFPTYDLIPQMNAEEVAEVTCRQMEAGKYDLIVINFANCDMVGHTGVYNAVVKAVETVDECVGRIVEATGRLGGISIVTADHGNAEKEIDDDGSPYTAHTYNKVPCIIVGTDVKLRDGKLCDIAPTILDLMGIEKPEEMTGSSLIIKN